MFTGSFIKVTDRALMPVNITRLYFYLSDIIGRYLSYFNPFVLFFKSPSHDSYTVRDIGLFNLFEFPLWVIGVFHYIKNIKKINSIFWISLIFGALPATFITA